MAEPLRIAIVGCGAIAQSHARAAAAVGDARLTALYDVEPNRAVALARAFARSAALPRHFEELPVHAEAAIVATPNAEHGRLSRTLLERGLHVLCEKPLALLQRDAEALVELAEERGLTFACGMVRRFFGSTRLVSELLEANLVGPPRAIEVIETVRNWPFSRASFDRSISGGGVFIDMAPHILDLLRHWFGEVSLVDYEDDARGGVEAVARCRAFVSFRERKLPVSITLSRAHGRSSLTIIECERGRLIYRPHDPRTVAIDHTRPNGRTLHLTATADAGDPFVAQLANFVTAVRSRAPLEAPARDAVAVVALIEEASQRRRPLVQVWDPPDSALGARPPFGKILVTGASGSVGSRMIEMWAQAGWQGSLRCLIRGYGNAARILRFPVEVAHGDLRDRASLLRAAKGCDAIVHLGVGDAARAETAPLLSTALELGIRRFVHMSSAAVYGAGLPRALEARQEATPLAPTGEPYADEKAGAEELVRKAGRSIDAVILRPHMVYGPGLRWTAELFELLQDGRVCILADGGVCNLIYVDDLVRAVTQALVVDSGFGQPMFVTDGAPLAWREYLLGHATPLGLAPPEASYGEVGPRKRTLSDWLRDSVRPLGPLLRSAEFRSLVFDSPAVQATVFPAYLRVRKSPWAAPLVARLRASSSAAPSSGRAHAFDPTWIAIQTSMARLRPDLCASVLGFCARVSFEEGLRRSFDYALEFKLIPSSMALP